MRKNKKLIIAAVCVLALVGAVAIGGGMQIHRSEQFIFQGYSKYIIGGVGKVVVLYKDRLLRFGFELIEYIASLYNCEIEIIDNTEKSEQQELVEDLVQIITVFSCKLQGKRANKARKLVKELIEGGEDSDKISKGNVDSQQQAKD